MSYGLATALVIGRLRHEDETVETYERVARRKAIWLLAYRKGRDGALILLASAMTFCQFWATISAIGG